MSNEERVIQSITRFFIVYNDKYKRFFKVCYIKIKVNPI